MSDLLRGLRRRTRRLKKRLSKYWQRQTVHITRWRDGDIAPDKPDYALVSYPKCGRTWVRFVMARALQYQHGYQTERYFLLTSRLYHHLTGKQLLVTHDARSRRKGQVARREEKAVFEGVSVVLLTRDIRDTLVSHYYHRIQQNRRRALTLSGFIQTPKLGIKGILRYYLGWYQAQDIPENLILVRYEDLRHDTFTAMRQIADSLGMADVSNDALQRAIVDGGFEKMRALEQAGKIEHRGMKLSSDPKDQQARRVRKGKVAGYMDELSPEDLAYIDEQVTQSGVPSDWVYASAVESPA